MARWQAERRRLAAWPVAALLALTAPAHSQVNNPAYADYFLVGQFGEICTMCEVMVLCEAGDAAPTHAGMPVGGSFTLYHIHTRTFWSQVSTIWEWFVANFSARGLAAGHRRPATVHEVRGGRWDAPVAGEVHVSLEPPRLAFSDGREIERIARRWRRSADQADIGYCQRLPLWPALDAVAAQDGTGPAS